MGRRDRFSHRRALWARCGAMVLSALVACQSGPQKTSSEEPSVDPGVDAAPDSAWGSTGAIVEGEQGGPDLSELEAIPASERTFLIDMVLVCNAPRRIEAGLNPEQRAAALSEYISQQIYTVDAVQFFNTLSTLDHEAQEAHFEETLQRLKIASCPFYEEQRRAHHAPEEEQPPPLDP